MAFSAAARARWTRRVLGLITAVFIATLYVPFLMMFVLSFTGPTGGPTLPLHGVSTYWYEQLLTGAASGGIATDGTFTSDVGAVNTPVGVPLLRSLALALTTTVLSTALGLLSALAFRRRFRGRNVLFYGTLLAAIVPGLTIGLGIALLAQEIEFSLGLMSTALLAHLIWTYPFSFVILVITFNRFDTTIEEAAAVLGANRWQAFRTITLPNISTGILTAALFSFTLSFDEYARSFFAAGSAQTLPLLVLTSLTGRVTPRLFALGAITTVISLLIVTVYITHLARRSRRATKGLGQVAASIDGS
jgi:putative spermidine/putrescine transport system permease protein